MATTEIKTIKPAGGGDYASLNAWELGERATGDLVAADKIKVAEVYSGGNSTTGSLGIFAGNGWITDKTRYIEIRAAAGHQHAGVFDTNKAYASTGGAYTFYLRVITRVKKMQVISSSSYAILFDNPSPGGENYEAFVDACLIKSTYGPLYIYRIKNINVTNCVCLATTGGANTAVIEIDGVTGAACTGIVLYNNTIVHANSQRGISAVDASSVVTSQNNYISAATCYYGTGTINKGANDATSTTEATTPALRSVAYSTDNFINVTPGSEDLHLTVTSALRTKGATIGSVTTDFEGDSRVGLIYDIGADQESDVPMCWNYTAKFKGSRKLFKTSGGGAFPRNLRVPGNVDKSTGRMIDDGKEIDPDHYEVF